MDLTYGSGSSQHELGGMSGWDSEMEVGTHHNPELSPPPQFPRFLGTTCLGPSGMRAVCDGVWDKILVPKSQPN